MSLMRGKENVQSIFQAISPANRAEMICAYANDVKILKELVPDRWVDLAKKDIGIAKLFFQTPKILYYMSPKEIAEIICEYREENEFTENLLSFLLEARTDMKAVAKENYHVATVFLESSEISHYLSPKDQAEIICHHRGNVYFMSDLPEKSITHFSKKGENIALTFFKAGIAGAEFTPKDQLDVIWHYHDHRSFMQVLAFLINDSVVHLESLIEEDPTIAVLLKNNDAMDVYLLEEKKAMCRRHANVLIIAIAAMRAMCQTSKELLSDLAENIRHSCQLIKQGSKEGLIEMRSDIKASGKKPVSVCARIQRK